jgi:adenine phosphoribosyltransferase
VDDVLATGGTAEAVGRLVARQGAELVSYSFLVDLTFLNGARRLGAGKVHSLLQF